MIRHVLLKAMTIKLSKMKSLHRLMRLPRSPKILVKKNGHVQTMKWNKSFPNKTQHSKKNGTAWKTFY